MWPFEPAEESRKRSVRVDSQGKTRNFPVKFLTWGHDVIAKSRNGSKEIASRWQK